MPHSHSLGAEPEIDGVSREERHRSQSTQLRESSASYS